VKIVDVVDGFRWRGGGKWWCCGGFCDGKWWLSLLEVEERVVRGCCGGLEGGGSWLENWLWWRNSWLWRRKKKSTW
jgi:hypothetical protein